MSSMIILAMIIAIGIIISILFLRNKYLKELKELEVKKNELNSRNITDHLGKVKQLNLSGETEASFSKWRTDWEDILGNNIPEIDNSFVAITENINRYKFAKTKDDIHLLENKVDTVNERINEILKEVDELISSKKKSMESMEIIKQQYRNCKKNLLAHRHNFTLAETKLEERLDIIKLQIASFEGATEQGNYIFASEICAETKASVDELEIIMTDVPKLQVQCLTEIPLQLENILDGFRGMEKDGYILGHLQIEEEVEVLVEKKDQCVELLKEIRTEEVLGIVEYIEQYTEKIYIQLEEEVKSKHTFEKTFDIVNNELDRLATKIIDTMEETKQVKEVYELHNADREIQKNIETQILLLQKKYENIERQVVDRDIAFSVMSEELNVVRNQLEKIQVEFDVFVKKMHELRKDEKELREILDELKSEMLDVRRSLKLSNIPGVSFSFQEVFETAQVSLQMVYTELEKVPLDMVQVNKLVAVARENVTSLRTQVDDEIEKALFAERIIQYGNRYRSRDIKNVQVLYEAETHFRDSQYDEAIEIASLIIEENDPGAVERLRESTHA